MRDTDATKLRREKASNQRRDSLCKPLFTGGEVTMGSTGNTSRTDWATVPTVFIVRPVCPHCSHDKYDRIRSSDNGDGSTTRKVQCRACGSAYKICVELPETGNSDEGVS